jgi:dTDP-4-dehydrorhamnose 3,5-epimerase
MTPVAFPDDRGVFLEWYRFDALEDVAGRSLDLRQANLSVSKKNVVRGVHYADVPPGQAKYVTVVAGAVIDIVVDIRVGSPTFGDVVAVPLDAIERKAVFLEEGLGHAFVALTDDTTVSYLVSSTYNPATEHGISPLDAELGLERWFDPATAIISAKDREAPTLRDALELGALPAFAARQGGV